MSVLGIYFGPTIISVVETKGKKVLHNIQISRLSLSAGELEEKLPYEVKLVAILKEEIRRNKIAANEATIVLSGQDLIIRSFDLPLLPANELRNAINFEAKKYIPFKVEDLVSDYQLQPDKLNRRNLILFEGIKKETLDKYLSVLNQLNIKTKAIEYSAFGILRLLRLNGISDNAVLGVISLDLEEKDEINFTVVENGFPLFSRDITLTAGPQGPAPEKEAESSVPLEKLKTEIRISLDYYHRKFPAKDIKKVFFISGEDYRSDLENFVKEMGISCQFMDLYRYAAITGKSASFSLSSIKAYSGSLSKVIKSKLKTDLLAAKEKAISLKEAGVAREAISFLTGLKVSPGIVILGLFICMATFSFGIYRRFPVHKELNNILNMRPKVSTVSPDKGYDELTTIDAEYKNKLNVLDKLIKEQLYLTKPLDVIPRIIPQGAWLVNFSFQKENDAANLTLEGMAYLDDSNKEFDLVNNFLSRLKDDEAFHEYFKEISIVSLNTEKFMEKKTATNFTISCRANKE